ncbi:unnamed protein product [Blepharisma stoltei]|uniref:Uncharacterized protein n=1 Tax=Blepharisma stoltei TaxID=1481888 RepID=A0AAU9K2S2_9CILI|nr:unnamed protein product [Blepharisma stoltei]
MEILKSKSSQVPRVRVQMLPSKENIKIGSLNLSQLIGVIEKREELMTPTFKPKFIMKHGPKSQRISRNLAGPPKADEKTQQLIDVRRAYFRSLSNTNRS